MPISSEDERISADEMSAEFQIELLDDYMARTPAHRYRAEDRE